MENLADLIGPTEYAELAGNAAEIPRLSPSKEAQLLNGINDILDAEGDIDDIDLETLIALGGSGLKIGRLELSPPTMEIIALLQTLDNPVLSPSKETDVRDIYEFCYVCQGRTRAVKPVMAARRALREIRKSSALAEKSPEFYRVYLEKEAALGAEIAAFDARVFRFGRALGAFDPDTVRDQIAKYLDACLGGFAMVPNAGGDDGKKKDMTPNG